MNSNLVSQLCENGLYDHIRMYISMCGSQWKSVSHIRNIGGNECVNIEMNHGSVAVTCNLTMDSSSWKSRYCLANDKHNSTSQIR